MIYHKSELIKLILHYHRMQYKKHRHNILLLPVNSFSISEAINARFCYAAVCYQIGKGSHQLMPMVGGFARSGGLHDYRHWADDQVITKRLSAAVDPQGIIEP